MKCWPRIFIHQFHISVSKPWLLVKAPDSCWPWNSFCKMLYHWSFAYSNQPRKPPSWSYVILLHKLKIVRYLLFSNNKFVSMFYRSLLSFGLDDLLEILILFLSVAFKWIIICAYYNDQPTSEKEGSKLASCAKWFCSYFSSMNI